MGIRKIGIMELMMCTVKPEPIRAPMPQATLNMATIIGETINEILRNKNHISRKITRPISGARMPI